MNTIKQIIETYDKCGRLEIEDIKILNKFYTDLIPMVEELGSEFGLMKIELHRRHEEIGRCLWNYQGV